MSKNKTKAFALVLALAMLAALLPTIAVSTFAATSGITEAAGWFESAYAEWASVSGATDYKAYIAPAGSSSWEPIDDELVRSYNGGYRVDAVGLKAGNYQIKIVPVISGKAQESGALITDTLAVSPYDRSGYAHFNYTEGVGAYNDDGTLKENAIVIYVTNENKNTVSVTSKDGTTVKGIGNILNSVGQDVGGGKCSKGGTANTNSDILRKLANDGTPLVVRIIGSVKGATSTNLSGATSEIDGLTQYDGENNGGSVGDNGFMARMSGGKDITIEGIGADATIDGWGLHFICQTADYSKGIGKSFEVRNIAFKNVPEDCVGMEGQQEGSTLTAPVERCWIHNCIFYAPVISAPAESDKNGGDGACDFKRGQYFTNSYCLYEGYHKTNLVGSSDSSLQYHLTYHHNYWKNCESRGPLARQANIHMYNNIFEGQTSYAMNPRANAYIFSEYNMFFKCKNPVQVKSGGVKSYNDSFASCIGDNHATVVSSRSESVSTGNKYANFDTNSSISYIPSGDYIIQESIGEMKAVVKAYAGTQKKTILSPEEVNTSVIPTDRYPTAAVVLDYSKSLNSTTVTSKNGTFDNVVFNVAKTASDCITVGGSPNDCDIVFYVDTEVNISMTEVSGTYSPVLCSANGEEIITGTGTASNLPSGYYFIQSGGYDIGSSKYKEAKLSSLVITAVNPGAATNPIPTPPAPNPDEGEGDNPGEGGNTGSGSGSGGTTIPAGAYTYSFVKSDSFVDPKGFFTFTGCNSSTSKGTVTYEGTTYDACLKMESSTKINFTAPTKGTLVLVFGGSTNASGKSVKIDDVKNEIDSTQVLTVDVEAGSHTVSKGDSINLFYIAYFSEVQEEHTHDYTEEVITAPTCTEAGLAKYACSCGDSYEEALDSLGHRYRDGECLNCGDPDPNYTPETPDDPEIPDNPETPNDPEIPEDPETPDNPETPETPENPDDTQPDEEPLEPPCIMPDEEPEEELNFFQKIWKAIVDFFVWLFGGKKD